MEDLPYTNYLLFMYPAKIFEPRKQESLLGVSLGITNVRMLLCIANVSKPKCQTTALEDNSPKACL